MIIECKTSLILQFSPLRSGNTDSDLREKKQKKEPGVPKGPP